MPAQMNAVLNFQAEHADCQSANGALSMDTLNEAVENLKKAGANVTKTPLTWHMKRTEDISERIKRLKEELNRMAPATQKAFASGKSATG